MKRRGRFVSLDGLERARRGPKHSASAAQDTARAPQAVRLREEIWRVELAPPAAAPDEVPDGARFVHLQGPRHVHYWLLVSERTLARWTAEDFRSALRDLHRVGEDV